MGKFAKRVCSGSQRGARAVFFVASKKRVHFFGITSLVVIGGSLLFFPAAADEEILGKEAGIYIPEISHLMREAASGEILYSNTVGNEEDKETEFERYLRAVLTGYPIEAMAPFLAREDFITAAFLVGIAKKESNWGRRAPSLEGIDCYNYWGYKGGGSRGFSLGYGCFSSPEEAVRIVGGRISELSVSYKRTTPEEMVVWKCGFSCAGHSPESVQKWISDVTLYYSRVVAYASKGG